MSKFSHRTIIQVIGASSLGTLIEWYDFYIFGSLAVVISTKFFPSDNPTAAFLSTLATFAAGFVVRPFGALVFGRLGDLVGRKYTFMLTLLLMGGATFLIGCIPSYETIGFMAPLLVLLLRLLQGLALGGEYGGAATYVAEHSPANQKGFWTSWIQTTATFGLFISLIVIMVTRSTLSADAFQEWGWRVPFWISILMVVVSYFIRKNMEESPAFSKAKTEGKIIKNPLAESFLKRYNLKFVLLALLGAAMGQGVVWYTGQFYAMSFINKVCGISDTQTDGIMIVALFLGTPFFVFFGWLSDKIGRKAVMMTGMLIAILIYRPVYDKIFKTVDVKNKIEISAKTTVETKEELKHDDPDILIQTVTTKKQYEDGATAAFTSKTFVMKANGKPSNIAQQDSKSIEINTEDKTTLISLVFIQVLLVTMVYGPIAAFLVEMFPVNIRYTSMSLPYHVGNGIFGGLLPTVAVYLTSNAKDSGNPEWYLQGLWYPISVTAICLIIGLLYIKTKNNTSEDFTD